MLPHYKTSFVADPEGPGICSLFLTAASFLLFLATLPLSLCMCVKVRDRDRDFKSNCQLCQGGAGVREGRHLQAGQAESRWSQGAGTLLRHALHWYLQKSCKLTEIPRFRWKIPVHTEPTENVFSGPQDSQLRCPSTRGDIQTKYWHWYYSSSLNIASKNCFCSINTYSLHPIHW